MAKRMALGTKGKRPGMFKQAVERLIAWSYSRWKDYEKCPAYCKFKHILRMREPDNDAMANGTIVHQLGDKHVRGVLKKFPKELGVFQQEFKVLQANNAQTEQEWAFDRAYNQVSWFSKEAWLRIKVDAHYLVQRARKAATKNRGLVQTTVTIVDYKTGKNHADHAQQRSLYALGGFVMYPDAVEVIAEHWYIDSGEIESDTFLAKDLPKLQKQWEQRTRAMLADTTFVPRPGAYCRWCAFSKVKGGPCKF